MLTIFVPPKYGGRSRRRVKRTTLVYLNRPISNERDVEGFVRDLLGIVDKDGGDSMEVRGLREHSKT